VCVCVVKRISGGLFNWVISIFSLVNYDNIFNNYNEVLLTTVISCFWTVLCVRSARVRLITQNVLDGNDWNRWNVTCWWNVDIPVVGRQKTFKFRTPRPWEWVPSWPTATCQGHGKTFRGVVGAITCLQEDHGRCYHTKCIFYQMSVSFMDIIAVFLKISDCGVYCRFIRVWYCW